MLGNVLYKFVGSVYCTVKFRTSLGIFGGVGASLSRLRLRQSKLRKLQLVREIGICINPRFRKLEYVLVWGVA